MDAVGVLYVDVTMGWAGVGDGASEDGSSIGELVPTPPTPNPPPPPPPVDASLLVGVDPPSIPPRPGPGPVDLRARPLLEIYLQVQKKKKLEFLEKIFNTIKKNSKLPLKIFINFLVFWQPYLISTIW